MGYVYLIINNINGHKYIGKTTQSIKKRWQEHLNDSKKEDCETRPLYRAIRKYGSEHFSIKEIERCDVATLSEREQYWIQYYNTYEDGYNATLGGDGRIVLDYDEIIKTYLTMHNATEVARVLNCSKDSVYKILKLNDIPIIGSAEIAKERNSKKVIQYDKSGNFIKEYASAKEAELAMGNTQRHIVDVANGRRKSAYGYIWRWKE